MGARVIGHDSNAWNNNFHIDRGTDDGISMNMPILADQGLVGVVRQVWPRRAQVVSIIDHGFSAAVYSPRTGDIGMVSGDIALMQQGLTRMNHIDVSAQLMPGDEILTSAHSSIFPPGLLVGTVVSIHPNPDVLTAHAIIAPVATPNDIEMVLIVTESFGTTIRDTLLGEE